MSQVESKKEKLENAANDMHKKIAFSEDVELHRDYLRVPWSDGTYTIFSIKPETTILEDNTNIRISHKLITSNHKSI